MSSFLYSLSLSSEILHVCIHHGPLAWKRNLSPMLTFALYNPWRPRHPSFWFPMVSIARTRTELPNKHILKKHLFVLDWMLKKMCQFVLKRIVQPQGQAYKYPGVPGHSPLCTCSHTPHLSLLFSTGRLRIREKYFPSIIPVPGEHSCHPEQHCVVSTASQVMWFSHLMEELVIESLILDPSSRVECSTG